MEEIAKLIKNLFREKINIVIALLTIIVIMNGFIIYQNNFEQIKTRKKIDHRYFNITQSLEDISKIEIDTKTGEIKPARN